MSSHGELSIERTDDAWKASAEGYRMTATGAPPLEAIEALERALRASGIPVECSINYAALADLEKAA